MHTSHKWKVERVKKSRCGEASRKEREREIMQKAQTSPSGN